MQTACWPSAAEHCSANKTPMRETFAATVDKLRRQESLIKIK